MKKYYGEGRAVYVTAAAAVVSDQPLLVGELFGFCGADALIGTKVALWVSGEFEVTKVAGVAWTEGQLIYWDAAANNFTTASTSGHTKVGVAVAAAASAAVLGTIRLNGP